MKYYGLLGEKLSHSFSKSFFEQKFLLEQISAQFDNIELQADELGAFFANNRYEACSVTIPHKVAVIPFLQNVTPEASAIGAVNCIKKQRGVWQGNNTDWVGFAYLLNQVQRNTVRKAMVLGNGGAAQAVKYVLRMQSIPYIIVSRQWHANAVSYADIDAQLLQEYNLIINCTPLGMYPDIEYSPALPYDLLQTNNVLIDLIYNPHETMFLKAGKKAGALTLNGQAMLEQQALAAWAWWQQ